MGFKKKKFHEKFGSLIVDKNFTNQKYKNDSTRYRE